MAFEHKPGNGSLFKNDYKQKDTHPDATGTCVTPDGKTWKIAAWTKQGQSGKFQSLSFSEPYQKAVGGRTDAQAPVEPIEDDGSIPF